jgi:hypothetical protein
MPFLGTKLMINPLKERERIAVKNIVMQPSPPDMLVLKICNLESDPINIKLNHKKILV